MTLDDGLKGIFTLVLGGLAAMVGWLVKTVMGTKEDLRLLEAKVENLERDKVTKQVLREEMDKALEKHEAACNVHKAETDKYHRMEMKGIIEEVLEKALPKYADELRGQIMRSNDTTQTMKRPRLTPRPPSGEELLDP